MRKLYRSTIAKYPKIPLSEERRLIALAKRGSKKSAEEIVLRHIGFVIFRLHKRIFPEYLKRFGEELLSESILILYQKIKTYDLDYCDKQGNPKPVKFVSTKPEITYAPVKVTKDITFSDETLYEIYDQYGNVVKKGFGKMVDCGNLSKGVYYLNYDNKTAEFIKK